MTGTFLKTFLARTNTEYKNKTIYNSRLIFQAIMAFYERECTIGAFVHLYQRKNFPQTFTIPTKLQTTLKLSKSNSLRYLQSSNTNHTNSNTDRYRQVECTGILSPKGRLWKWVTEHFQTEGKVQEIPSTFLVEPRTQSQLDIQT
jgi:hypothetical protein